MKLYTRTGDDGSTSLFGGRRVPKDDARIAACGDVDELNAAVGLVLAALHTPPLPSELAAPLRQRLTQMQSELFEIGADLATPADSPQRSDIPAASAEHVARLEKWIDEAQAAALPMKHFVLPGGCETACRLHAARTVSRRAERAVVTLARSQSIGPCVIPYLNRVSDLLFAWARWANHASAVPDVPWLPPPAPQASADKLP